MWRQSLEDGVLLLLGTPMYQLTYKLKGVKQALFRWAKERNLNDPFRVFKYLKDALVQIQEKLVMNPLYGNLILEEKRVAIDYYHVAKEEESTKLKSRAIRLKCGD